jgi:hypothetical protein
MNRGLLRVFGIGAWANCAWDFNYYFIHGRIISFLHNWLVLVPIFAIFFGYPIVGLFLIFAKMSFRMDIAQRLDDIEIDLDTVPDIELEASRHGNLTMNTNC